MADKILKEDFTIVFDVAKIGAIKAWKKGENNPDFVKFRASNIIEVDDPDVGFREVETVIDFRLDCDTAEIARKIKQEIAEKRSKNETIHFRGNLPRKEKADEITTVKSVENVAQFCKSNNIKLDGAK